MRLRCLQFPKKGLGKEEMGGSFLLHSRISRRKNPSKKVKIGQKWSKFGKKWAKTGFLSKWARQTNYRQSFLDLPFNLDIGNLRY